MLDMEGGRCSASADTPPYQTPTTDLGFRVSEFKVEGLECTVLGSGCRVGAWAKGVWGGVEGGVVVQHFLVFHPAVLDT